MDNKGLKNLYMIVAVDREFGIGKENSLLCHIQEDLNYFKAMTMDSVVVMGYNTFMSLPIKPLPGRTNIVITRKDISIEGCEVVHSIEELIALIERNYQNKKVFVCGGQSIYEQLIDYSSVLYITHIFDSFSADTFFPNIEGWKMVDVSCDKVNIMHKHPHIFARYERES